MNAVPLYMPDGELVGYACWQCRRIAHAVSCSNHATELKAHREEADQCCLCHRCNAIMSPARSMWFICCDRCEQKEKVEREARRADPVERQTREQAAAAQQAVRDGPCADAKERLRQLYEDDDLDDADRAACRVGAEALAGQRVEVAR